MIILLLIFGLFVGSFLGVLVDRVPKGRPIVFDRSRCPHCKHVLSWYELIPLVSFVLQGGKCRNCKTKLSFFYPGIELVTGLMFAITGWWLISNNSLLEIDSIFYFFIVSMLLTIFFIDLKHRIIPDKIIFPLIIVIFLWLLLSHNSVFFIYLASAFGASIFLIIITLLYLAVRHKESMGGGDIKLAFLMGLLLGFPNIIIAFYGAFLTGAFVSIILILWGKLNLRDAIPFGPFLVFGTLVAFFLGNQILDFALPFFGL